MIFLESHLTASPRQTSAILPPFMSFPVHSAEPHFPLREKLSDRIGPHSAGTEMRSLSVRFHYHVMTNRSCDKFTRFEKSASIIYIYQISRYRLFTELSHTELVSPFDEKCSARCNYADIHATDYADSAELRFNRINAVLKLNRLYFDRNLI